MNSAYNSEEGEKWKDYKPEIDPPHPSECSVDNIDLFS